MKKREYCGNRPAKLRFMIIDFFVDLIVNIFGSKKNQSYVVPQKVLLFNYGHLGDMLMMGYIINALKIKHSTVEIHLVAGRWCRILIENNPLYDKVFYLDHFQNNRQSISFLNKYFRHFKDSFSVIKSLRKENYSHSFDFRYSAYNANQLLPFLKINQKNGFGTRGLGGLLDNEYFLLKNGVHTIDVQAQGLKNIDVDIESRSIKPVITIKDETYQLEQLSSEYIIIFPEAGNSNKMLLTNHWEAICQSLLNHQPDIQLVICGLTKFSIQLFHNLSHKYGHKIVDASRNLSIPQIIRLLKNSKGAITLDSFPAHLAASQTQTLCLFKNGSGSEYFPINSFPTYIIHDHKFSKTVDTFRDKMTIDYVENFDDSSLGYDWISKMSLL
ncbi:MAG: glycosyltransferase family 9 protein [Arcicella sp.]|nr:glycosyltransferase family 9 protein [Arcicella sp.]